MAHKNQTNRSPYAGRNAKGKTSAEHARPGSSTYSSGGSGHSPRSSGNGGTGYLATRRHRMPKEDFTFDEADDRIADIFRNHGFASFPHEKRQVFTKFYQLLMKEQKNQNFTRLVSLREVTIKHFLDCLMVPRLVNLEFPLLDLGTGPGFPGIPLKIQFSEERIILAEGVQKRVDFLKKVRSELGLRNLDILGKNIMSDFQLPTQSFITRAVEDVSNTLNKAQLSLPIGGKVYFMKGPNVDPEIEDAKSNQNFSLIKNIEYEIPQTPNQRRLLVYEKHS